MTELGKLNRPNFLRYCGDLMVIGDPISCRLTRSRVKGGTGHVLDRTQTVIKTFTVTEVLGRGSYGTVAKAHFADEGSDKGEVVAIKTALHVRMRT